MSLFKPWTSKNPAKRLKAVKKLTDQQILKRLAEYDPLPEVKRTAFARLDQKTLFEIAQKGYRDIALLAIKSLTSEADLLEIAKTGSYNHAEAAVKRLKSKAALLDVAINADSAGSSACDLLAKQADDADYLDIAKNARCHSTRSHAIEFINEASILMELAVNNDDDGVRWAAVCKIDNAELLFKIATGDPAAMVRREALNKINGQAECIEIAMRDRDSNIQTSAILKIKDEGALAVIAKRHHQKHDVVDVALDKITNQKLLRELVEFAQHKSWHLYSKAMEKITDSALLMTWLKNAQDNSVFFYAQCLLKLPITEAEQVVIFKQAIEVSLLYAAENPVFWLRTASLIPKHLHETYAITLEQVALENEDQYGRHMATHSTVYYQGKEVFRGYF